MMDTGVNLELFLVTYNRKEKLAHTLNTVLAADSPIKNFPLTILDNCSTDGTSELIETYCAHYPNVKHVRHTKNIGGNANITRAFESAQAEYVWILCDDDLYTLENWPACQEALAKKPAMVVVSNYLHPQKGNAYLFRQLSFVPAAIYRTELITSDTLLNMYFNISNMFPHLAVAAQALNTQKPIIILDKPLVTMQMNTDAAYTRGSATQQNLHPLLQEMYWIKGYLRSLPLLQNPALRKECSTLTWAEDYTSSFHFYNIFCDRSRGRFWADYTEAVHLLTGPRKWAFACWVPFLKFIICFYKEEKGIHVRLFGRIKIRLWKFSTSQKN